MNTLRRIYLFSFLDDFMVIYPLYAVMFADKGLTTAQISLLFVVWSVAGLLLEVPSGVLADRIDRRLLLASGELIRAGGYLIWLLVPNFFGFLIGFIMWGVQGAFSSGTLEAFVFDELKATQSEDKYVKVSGRCQALGLIAYLAASILAIPVANNGYTWPLIASVVASLATAVVAFSLPKVAPVASVEEDISVFRNGWREVRKSRVLIIAISFAALAGSFFGSIDEYAELFVSDIGIDNAGVAVAATAFALFAAVGSILAHRIGDVSRRIPAVILVFAGVSLFVAVQIHTVVGVGLMTLFMMLSKVVSVVADADVQHTIVSDGSRATITSMSNLIVEFAALAVFVLFTIASVNSRFVGFAACGVTLMVLSMVFVVLPSSGRQKG